MTHGFKSPKWAWLVCGVVLAAMGIFGFGVSEVKAQNVNGFKPVGAERQSFSSRRTDGKAVRVYTTPATNGKEEGVIVRVSLEGFRDKSVGIPRSALPELEKKNYPEVVAQGWFDFIGRIGRALRDFLQTMLSKLKKESSNLLKMLLKIIEDYIGEILTAVLSSALLSDEEKVESAETSAKAFSAAAKSNAKTTADRLNMALEKWVRDSTPKARPVVVSAIQASFAKRAQ